MKERIKDNRFETIVAQLATDGFPRDVDTARKVQRASERGMLYWTTNRLTTSDESQLDLRPAPASMMAGEQEATLALTLIQPWAYAIERLEKRIENRSWAPPHWVIGTRIYIHAGMKCDRESCESLRDAGFELPDTLARGSIGCSALLRGWVRPNGQCGGAIDRQMAARVLADEWYVPGQVAWVLDEVRLLAARLVIPGQQGLWRVKRPDTAPANFVPERPR